MMGSGRRAINKPEALKNGEKQPVNDESEDSSELTDKKGNAVPFLKLFRFSGRFDRFLIFIATLCAIAHGAAWPCMVLIMGDSVQSFVDQAHFEHFLDDIPEILKSLSLSKHYIYTHLDEFRAVCANISDFSNGSKTCGDYELGTDTFDDMEDQCVLYALLGVGTLVTAFGQLFLFIWTSERQILRLRVQFYRNILRQEMTWFDSNTPGSLVVKMTDDIGQIHDAIGDKIGTALQNLASSVASVIISFAYGWELTLVMLSAGPALFIPVGLVSSIIANMTAKERIAYAKAGAVAEEVFSSIRTVAAFGGQNKETTRYCRCIEEAKKYGIRKSRADGLCQGMVWFTIFTVMGLGFWYGGKLVRDGDYTEKEMIIVYMTAMYASLSLGMAVPALTTVKDGCGAAYGVYEILEKKSKIDSLSPEGLKPASMSGRIRFQNVTFCYPSRPEVKVLDGMDLTVMPGQTVAIVGTSGCGKSTTMRLLLRFYDVDTGKVTVDNLDVRKLNLKWLRQRIGLVRQEPVLFPTTIAENIRYGREGVTMEEIIQASKDANAYDFIMKMPDTFQTHVGERGAQMSGGQKQRIAIARALISDPKILLLDEATSALDSGSEAIVQDALDKARQGRSTIIIAHRLSTIRNVDVIVTLGEGKVIEKGTHNQLMSKKGAYYQLVSAQLKMRSDSMNDGDESTEASDAPSSAKIAALERSKGIKEECDESLEGTKYVNRSTFWRLLKMNKNEWPYLASGVCSSLINGVVQPAFGVLTAFIVEGFTKDDEDDQKDLLNAMALVAVALGFLSLVSYFFQVYSFGVSGESLTKKMRSLSFRSMMRQEIGWFDDEEHQTGVLGSQLAVEASLVQGAVRTVFGSTINCIGNMVTGFTIGFIYSWRLTLLAIAFVPFVIVTGLLNIRYLGGAANEQKAAMEEASKESMASIDNIQTVAALAREDKFNEEFSCNLSKPYQGNAKRTLISSVTYGVTQAAYYFSYAACFYYASRLLRKDKIDSSDAFKVFYAIIFASVHLGQSLAFIPNMSKALQAAGRIFSLADAIPKIDPYSTGGLKPKEGTFTSSVRFSSANFRYPTRQDVCVLSKFDMTVEPGQMLALVGESGCGKSTIVQILQRFYDTESGHVFLDKYNIKDLNVQWLRSQIGMVSQEPILFDTSIAENIAYGDNSREVSMNEIIAAARTANIHHFVQGLPDGYETNVGSKGTQLSGGQKQRVAIARALIRNPKILLLDEATSALDTESEKVVQEALDRAREGRTCITIAHRLSTIQTANVIAVLKGGKVSEQGTHSQLMAMKSQYYHLQKAQGNSS